LLYFAIDTHSIQYEVSDGLGDHIWQCRQHIVAAGAPLATIRAEEDGAAAQAPGALVEAAIARQDANLGIQVTADLAAAARGDRVGFEAALSGLMRTERMHRQWGGALALTTAELRAV
jgi:hypothetical protein